MAKMIPPRIPTDTKSSAERKVFYKLKDMEDTDHWTVLHSVGIADHPTQSQGEADFVVVIPDGGVFVLEVKGGGISFHDGIWKSTDRNLETHEIKNPAYEANEAMHAFANYLRNNIPSINPVSHSLFGFGVVFPDSEMHGKFTVPDLGDSQIADKNDLFDLKQYLLKLSRFWKERKAPSAIVPNASACKEIIRLLRPEFDSHIALIHQIENVERQTITMTEEQEDTFYGLIDNERCLVRGSAGTGKTVLAINKARDLTREGKRVAFFCYNRQLADYLRQNLTDDGIDCCGSLTDYMMETLKRYSDNPIEPDKEEDKNKFYKETLPDLFADCFIENELPEFDYLVIDEAQDLMTEKYLDVLDMILSGGLNEGYWCLFMDADRQNIFHAGMSYEDIKNLLRERKVFYARFEINKNCRNSVAIIEEIDNLFGSNTRYPAVEEKGTPVVKKIYRRDKDQAKMVVKTIKELLAEEVDPERITILSPYRYQNSVAPWISPEIPVSEKHEPGHIFFSTIDGFKGLENSVIIITDISDIHWEKDSARLYVGMTRAKSALYLFLSEKANRNIGKLKSKGEVDG